MAITVTQDLTDYFDKKQIAHDDALSLETIKNFIKNIVYGELSTPHTKGMLPGDAVRRMNTVSPSNVAIRMSDFVFCPVTLHLTMTVEGIGFYEDIFNVNKELGGIPVLAVRGWVYTPVKKNIGSGELEVKKPTLTDITTLDLVSWYFPE